MIRRGSYMQIPVGAEVFIKNKTGQKISLGVKLCPREEAIKTSKSEGHIYPLSTEKDGKVYRWPKEYAKRCWGFYEITAAA